MTNAHLNLLAAQGLAFAVWAFFMFKTLYRLHRRGSTRSGYSVGGPFEFLRNLQYWLTSPEDRRDRGWLLSSFLVLTLLTVLIALR